MSLLVEQLAVAVARRIALLVALDVDLDVVAFHGHIHAQGAGDIDPGALAHQATLGGIDHNLAAGGQRQRVLLEVGRAAAGDLDTRLVAAVGDEHEVLGTGHRRTAQAIALAVQRRGLAVVLDDYGGGGPLAEHNAAGAADGIEDARCRGC
ncbi:hypothetical protein ACU4GD_31845 [Cupriavidus basilensis]